MSTVTSVTKHFPSVNEGFNSTLSAGVLAGGATVGLNSVAGMVDGSVFVGIVEPATASQQVFTGTVDLSGSQITGVVWTRGTNVDHALGSQVVDYVTGTAINMITKGMLASHNQDGTLKTNAVSLAAMLGGDVVTTAKIADDAVTPAKIDFANLYRSVMIGGTASTTSSSYNIATYTFTAPFTGKMVIDGDSTIRPNTTATVDVSVRLYVNAADPALYYKYGRMISTGTTTVAAHTIAHGVAAITSGVSYTVIMQGSSGGTDSIRYAEGGLATLKIQLYAADVVGFGTTI